MIVLLNESKIVYESFATYEEMVNRILLFVSEGKSDHIIYKGVNSDIDGKEKRRFVLNEYNGDLNDIEKVKKYFDRKTNYKTHDWCLLYKNK